MIPFEGVMLLGISALSNRGNALAFYFIAFSSRMLRDGPSDLLSMRPAEA
jgi:hypothetical protein